MDIYNGLDPQHFESHVCTFFAGEYDHFFEERRHLRHILVGDKDGGATSVLGKGVNMFKRIARLKKVIAKSGAHLIHTHHLGPLLHYWFARHISLHRLPWIHTEHNVPDLAEGYADPVYKRFEPLRRPDVVTGVAPNVCGYLKDECQVDAQRVRLVPNGVDLDRFTVQNGRDKIRAELGLQPEDEVIGCIGNLRQEKNQKLAVDAVALALQKRPNLKLIVCGDGDCRDELEKQVKDRGISDKTFFLGFRFDIPEVLSALDLFCLPSVYEGMPVSVLEAWTSNKAVVATDVIGIHDLVDQDKNGLLVPPGDPQAMADAISSLMADTAHRVQLASAGNDLVTRQYSLTAMVGNYAGLYQQIAEK